MKMKETEKRLLETPYYNDTHTPEPKNEYVCWIDIMGTRSRMIDSVRTISIFIFKFHTVLLNHRREGITIYPLMDGAYITSSSQIIMLNYLKEVFFQLAETIICADNNLHKFIVRAGLAYGLVTHGRDVPESAGKILAQNENIRNAILLGAPMIYAYQCECLAPPFGIYIHESIRLYMNNSDRPIKQKWWKWWFTDKERFDDDFRTNFITSMKSYYDFATNNSYVLEYDNVKINEHRKMFEQYIGSKE